MHKNIYPYFSFFMIFNLQHEEGLSIYFRLIKRSRRTLTKYQIYIYQQQQQTNLIAQNNGHAIVFWHYVIWRRIRANFQYSVAETPQALVCTKMIFFSSCFMYKYIFCRILTAFLVRAISNFYFFSTSKYYKKCTTFFGKHEVFKKKSKIVVPIRTYSYETNCVLNKVQRFMGTLVH